MMDTECKFVAGKGVRIGVDVAGQGKAVLLVHGTSSMRSRWRPALPFLPEDRALWLMDRRGRGLSGDSSTYTLEDEVTDIAAVANAAGAMAIVAHSYGAILALEAAAQIPTLERMVLYEAPVPVPPHVPDPADAANIAAISAAVEAGRPDEAVTLFLRDVLKMPAHQIAAARQERQWQTRVALAHTLPRELAAVRAYRLDPARIAPATVPVRLLLGSESPPRYVAATELLADALPNSEVKELPGQTHNAITVAPQIFAAAVNPFLAQ